jgi:hypothetical protein
MPGQTIWGAVAAAAQSQEAAGAHWHAQVAVVVITIAAIVASVLLHYEGLTLLQRNLGHVHVGPRRMRVLFGIIGVLLMHAIEISFFALGYAAVHSVDDGGAIHGMPHPHFLDLSYFSAITYTTVGYGDLVPIGPLRFIAAVESLAGFVLVSWSASFTYLVMERFWGQRS